MTVYGFRDQRVALTLKEMALAPTHEVPQVTGARSSPYPIPVEFTRKLHLATITEEVTAAKFESGEYIVGKGKALIWGRDKSNSDTNKRENLKVVTSHDGSKVVDDERTVYNFRKEAIAKTSFSSEDPATPGASTEFVLLTQDHTGDLYVVLGGGGATLSLARACENIPAIEGWLSEDEPDSEDEYEVRELAEDDDGDKALTMGRGKVQLLTTQAPEMPEQEEGAPEPDPDDYPPPKIVDQEREAEDQGDPPADPPIMEKVRETWYNCLTEPILKNSVVVGTTVAGYKCIVAIAPTTLRRNPDPD